MKLSVSLPPEQVTFIDRYREQHALLISWPSPERAAQLFGVGAGLRGVGSALAAYASGRSGD